MKREKTVKRRDFLKTLSLLPAVGFFPTIVVADELNSDSSTDKIEGLQRIVTIIQNDKGLNRKRNKRVSQEDIAEAIESVERMNEILIEAIIETGTGNDKRISIADVRFINDYIFHNYQEEWKELHGDDEEDEESGFHKVVNDGARTKLFGKNAINRVADSIYHLGFESHLKNRLLNEDGNKNSSYKRVAEWLDSLLKTDLEAGRLVNPNVQEIVGGSNTGLDKVIEIIYNDVGLNKKISTGDMREGAKSANAMIEMLLEAIDTTNAGKSGLYTIEEIKAVNLYLIENYANEWKEWHGDDEDDKEWGYHKVQNDGAKTRLYGKNAINKVFDGIFHLGFERANKRRLTNEDGDKNVSFKRVTEWLNNLMTDDLNNSQEDLQLLVPLYSYPNWYDEENYVWQELIDVKTANPDAQITAIINPSNGHFNEQNSDYVHGIQDLIDAGITIVGYVYTGYGNRPTQEVIDDMEAWKVHYKELGVSGIFFDETSTDSAKFSYYSDLSSEAKNRELNFIILNPGITTDQVYIDSGIADVVVSYENPNDTLLSNPPATYNTPSSTTELSLLIYEMSSDNVDDLISFAREHDFAHIYFTEDGTDGNPWDTLSVYFEDEVKKAKVG